MHESELDYGRQAPVSQFQYLIVCAHNNRNVECLAIIIIIMIHLNSLELPFLC